MDEEKHKAIGLLSGGLDSTLAVGMILNEGVEVIALNFVSPFCTCTKKGCRHQASKVADDYGIEIKVVPVGVDYIEMIRNPKHGYGKNLNPCKDCRIFILKKAKALMEELGASFIFTGDVLGQRPMSQRRPALDLIEKEAGLEGLILRPLSARHFKPTIPEKEGWVNRDNLLGFMGRNRKPQMKLAEEMDIRDYDCPAGGCRLTNREFSNKLRDLFVHNEEITNNDLLFLRIGRHFRFGDSKIIVGRDEKDNDMINKMSLPEDHLFEVPGVGSPISLLRGEVGPEELEMAARLTARYSDSVEKEVNVIHRYCGKEETLNVVPLKEEKTAQLHI